MSENKLRGRKILMVIAPENFRDEELFEPKAVFEAEGAVVLIASRSLGRAKGMLGGTAEPDLLLSDAMASDYDAIIVVGGSGSPDHLWHDETLHRMLREADQQKKIIGAICLAGAALARAGLLEGRQATIYKTKDSLKEYERAGVKYVNRDVVIDDRFITASGPRAAKEFGKAIVEMLSK
jgi:protease I